MAQWIWRFGEFEIYHSSMVHRKRQAYGYYEPTIWKVYRPEPVVEFRKKIITAGGKMNIRACGHFSTTLIDAADGKRSQYFGKEELELSSGEYMIHIQVMNFDTFPALYIDGIVETDVTWEVDDMSMDYQRASTWDVYNDRDQKPDRFPFAYESITAVRKESTEDGGVLYDFGKETFAGISLSGLKEGKFQIRYGESREEAMDADSSVIHFTKTAVQGKSEFRPYAFRYLYLTDSEAEIEVKYEYLPMKHQGSFQCSDLLLNKIWRTAVDTFHLNCREMFLDGIKRDRWVWSADVYQCLFVNRYLFRDEKIEERTLIALGGKVPFRRHINTIMDYTFFWFMSLYEHYKDYGNKEFLEQMKPQMDEIMEFCLRRTDPDGFMREREGDWVFIDWGEMDRTGALCAEQILYAEALKNYSALCHILGEPDKEAGERAKRLRAAIIGKYWDAEKGAFIDSFESGRRYVSRQSNIFAYLFLQCSKEQNEQIYKNVILNPSIESITTPYFKFYENQVHCMAGNAVFLDESIREYYGGMLEAGATSLYEQFDPKETGLQHYAMYGRKYEKSLCHAWSASPVYLFGRFRLGVVNTGVNFDHFEVKPQLGNLQKISGKVPVSHGYVTVMAEENEVKVYSEIPGGILYWKGKRYTIHAGNTRIVRE